MLQWNFHVPAAGAVNVAVFPASIVTSNPPVLSDVTVCCEGLERFDTSAMQILLGLWRDLHAQGRNLRLVGMSAETETLLQRAGVTGVIACPDPHANPE